MKSKARPIVAGGVWSLTLVSSAHNHLMWVAESAMMILGVSRSSRCGSSLYNYSRCSTHTARKRQIHEVRIINLTKRYVEITSISVILSFLSVNATNSMGTYS